MYILGISSFYHDSAACLIKDGVILAAAQEERFTRKKHDANFPVNAIDFCLSEAKVNLNDIQYVCFYDKPFLTFERLLETYLSYAPFGFKSFSKAMPLWIKDKLFIKNKIRNELKDHFKITKKEIPEILFTAHHQSHAGSAFFASPFEEAAVLCLDGVGEWATTSVWHGKGNELNPLWEIQFPHSIGLLYSAFTYYTGFKVNSGEYKVMGLAPYGEDKYSKLIKEHLIDIKDDGTFRLNMDYFDFATGLTMTNKKFDKIFGGPPRTSESEVTQKEMDLAKSIQVVIEEVVLKICRTIKKETGLKNICLAGGVALNCVANGKIYQEEIFENIWIQPAAGDAGGAIGAALCTWYQHLKNPRKALDHDFQHGSYLGPQIKSQEIDELIKKYNLKAKSFTNQEEVNKELVGHLTNEKVIGLFQGKMEFGPRALGGRSIIADPRSTKMQSTLNLKIKYRESFRPFAPAILAEDVNEYFEYKDSSPYMLMVANVNEDKRIALSDEQEKLFGIEKLNIPKSIVPAITHVDYSARLQTVHKDTNPYFYSLIKDFKDQTGCPLLINTSFNIRGEPIVCSALDALKCFMRTEMDVLVLENYVLKKEDQPKDLKLEYLEYSLD